MPTFFGAGFTCKIEQIVDREIEAFGRLGGTRQSRRRELGSPILR
jgi:hypothetical protein